MQLDYNVYILVQQQSIYICSLIIIDSAVKTISTTNDVGYFQHTYMLGTSRYTTIIKILKYLLANDKNRLIRLGITLFIA